jgi:transposase-like protein
MKWTDNISELQEKKKEVEERNCELMRENENLCKKLKELDHLVI